MRIRTFQVVLACILAAPLHSAEDVATILERQTTELLRAVDTGSSTVWDYYLHTNAVITDENGVVSTKSQMVVQIRPFPPGISGHLALQDFHARMAGTAAVATYVIDEQEIFYGHKLHCQYRNTDTWVSSAGGWRLLASQALALRTDPPSIPLSRDQRSQYVGRYTLSPTKTYEIRMNEGRLEGQEAGRPPELLLAEAPDVLFVPGKPRYRRVIQRAPDGHVTGFAERREAWDLLWSRLP